MQSLIKIPVAFLTEHGNHLKVTQCPKVELLRNIMKEDCIILEKGKYISINPYGNVFLGGWNLHDYVDVEFSKMWNVTPHSLWCAHTVISSQRMYTVARGET